MSDSNEPADVTGPDTPPKPPAQNDPPETTPDTPPPAQPAPVAEPARQTPSPERKPEPQEAAEPVKDASVDRTSDQAPSPQTETQPEPAPEPQEATEPVKDASVDETASQAPSPHPEPQPEPKPEPQEAAKPVQDTPPATADNAETPVVEGQQAPQAPSDKESAPKPPADKPKDQRSKPQGKPSKQGGPPKSGGGGQSPGRGRSSGSPRRRPGKPPKGPSVVIRYGIMGHLGQFRHSLQPPPARGVNVVIRTDRGVELGEVMTVVSDEGGSGQITPARLEEHIRSNGPDYPFRRDGKILRLTNPQDLIDQRHLNSSARDERKFCSQEIKDMKLDMKLVAVEHLLGGERIIFYFLAEHRVDFRDLVHKLANQYHTRIEMRQVGARDEARLVGDYERCGQECCCKQFLKGLQPVSMRMAKTQKATLDPSKISGRCGRLMCCLRYEDQCYRDLKKCLPHKNIWVKTCDKIGRVTGTQILTQLVQVQLPDGSRGVFANEDIIERDVDPPKPPEPISSRSSRQSDRKGKQQGPAGRQKPKPDAGKQKSRPPRRQKLEARPEPKPKPEPQPRAEAEALDPAWGTLLGDSIAENDKAQTQTPPQSPQTAETAPSPEETPVEESRSAERRGDQGGGKAPASGERRKKRRRRRGRRSKGKPQNG